MKLFDRIVARTVMFRAVMNDGQKMKISDPGNFVEDICADTEIFSIQNVADYYASVISENWSIYKDFPCPMPPFDHIWMEYSPTHKTFNLDEPDAVLDWSEINKDGGVKVGLDIRRHGPIDFPADHKCTLTMLPIICSDGVLNMLNGELVLMLDEQGNPVRVNLQNERDAIVRPIDVEYLGCPDADTGRNILELCKPGLLALSLCNCKNVVTEVKDPPTKKSKQHMKTYGRPLTQFRTVKISDIFTKRAGETTHGEMTKAVSSHICRGHFADYTEKGLFGKYKGRFWFGQHVRGSKKVGTVKHDYKVEKGGQ